MTYNAANWASDVRGAEYKFLGVVRHALEQFNAGNHTELAKLLCITHGKKSGIVKVVEGDRLKYAAPLKRVLKRAFINVDARFDGKKKAGVSFKVEGNGGVDCDVIETLRVLGSIRVDDKRFKAEFPTAQAEKKEATPEQVRERLHKYMEKMSKDTGIPMDQLKAMASAA